MVESGGEAVDRQTPSDEEVSLLLRVIREPLKPENLPNYILKL